MFVLRAKGGLLKYYLVDGALQVTTVYVAPEFRGRGVATLLFQRLFTLQPAMVCHLDDCSDRFGQEDNLYRRLGFWYVEPGHPEMLRRPAFREY